MDMGRLGMYAKVEEPKSERSGQMAPIRVMVVDDSVVIRGLFSRWIEADPELEVAATHRNGELAVKDIERSNPDVVVLDVEMPVMDGLTALPKLLEKKRDLIIVMASTLTRRNAEVSLKALSLGATDYVAKPETTGQTAGATEFQRELLEKLRLLGRGGKRIKRTRITAEPVRRMRAEIVNDPHKKRTDALAERTEARAALRRPRGTGLHTAGKQEITLRPYSSVVPRALVIGSSTGGPQALQRVLTDARDGLLRVPVVITQHMPRTFTTILAEHLHKQLQLPSKEAEHMDVLKPGHVYIAPGGIHLKIGKQNGQAVSLLEDGAPVNFCKPSVDPLFESAAEVFGTACLALVLTGMGSDGASGVNVIAGKGGSVIAQDEASSVVWGMPGAAARTGNCSGIVPLDQIGAHVKRILKGAAR
ncbi:Chemotaxis response regulator protein-glutamate methylesterase [Pseudovibrio sp. Ad14]|nr:Chemotaxis response regulator protein-glutamate methylesterase [Pseudovibrio sp. W74]KZL04207.1 Chemotaxis response regulator protein-glutamate methylesterase [Pseudovibrio sp. Ad14]